MPAQPSFTTHDPSIVIPAWNEADYLPATLAALKHAQDQLAVHSEIIVVDNASTDVHETEHCIARVRNTGAAAARGDWLLFVDADTQVTPAQLRGAYLAMTEGCGGGGAPIGFDRLDSTGQRLGLMAWNALSRRMRLAAGSMTSFMPVTKSAIPERFAEWPEPMDSTFVSSPWRR